MDWQDGPVRVLIGDVRERLRDLPDESCHCVVTSPPYWGLRDYGIAGQLGLETTPDEYVAAMVEVFRELRRVLRRDGALWLNLGDSYAANRTYQVRDSKHIEVGNAMGAAVPPGLKPKDLVGIPWRLALALQADGWWLRSDVIWSKPNPMPESVTDRPTKAHEYVFLLTKSARYFYDAEAVREAWTSGRDDMRAHGVRTGAAYIQQGSVMDNDDKGPRRAERNQHDYQGDRNLRSVWTIATQPYPEAHFATFPEELARRCIAAGTSECGCCPECGAPWRRVVERTSMVVREGPGRAGLQLAANGSASSRTAITGTMLAPASSSTTGWRPTCTHDHDPIPCTVLDPFAGSGTTLAVARRMGRRAVGIELQEAYLPLIQQRVLKSALPLLETALS